MIRVWVAGGIKIALLTTATGLIIAIPVNIAYNWCVTRIDRLIVAMEQGAQEVFNLAWDLERDGHLTVVDDRSEDEPHRAAAPAPPAATPASAPSMAATAAATAVADVAGEIGIEEIEGIGPGYGKRLRELGLATTLQFLHKCSTAAGRAEVVQAAGLEELAVRRWTSAADFFRIPGMTGDSAEILEASGIQTVQGLAAQAAGELADRLVSVNEEQRLVVRQELPGADTIQGWISAAAGLDAVVSDL